MYFLRPAELRGASTGLLEQSVQIVASHDLTLVVEQSVQIVASHDPTFVVRPHSRGLEQELDFDRLERKLDATFGCAIKDAGK